MSARPSRVRGAAEASRIASQRKRAEQRSKKRNASRRRGDETKGFRFDDPYWDDAFDSYHDPTLRTCCRI